VRVVFIGCKVGVGLVLGGQGVAIGVARGSIRVGVRLAGRGQGLPVARLSAETFAGEGGIRVGPVVGPRLGRRVDGLRLDERGVGERRSPDKMRRGMGGNKCGFVRDERELVARPGRIDGLIMRR
jgi:hypothetical protein